MKSVIIYNKTYYLRIFLAVYLIFLFQVAFSKETNSDKNMTNLQSIELNQNNSSWYSVIGGTSVTKPLATSYGFVLLTDGRLMIACSDNGKILWQKNVKVKTAPFFTLGYSDTFYTVSQNAKLSLYNPSGMELWTIQLKELPIENPIIGKDGRIFIRAANSICCVNLAGKVLWNQILEKQSNIPIQQFSDGSILAILEKQKNGMSVALRISKDGEILEEITFTNIISNATYNSSGIILSFIDNQIACISLVDEKAKTIWNYSASKSYSPKYLCSDEHYYFLIYDNEFICMNNYGKQKWNYQTQSTFGLLKDFSSTSNGFVFLSDSECYHFNLTGKIQQSYKFNFGNKAYPFILPSGYIAITDDSWCVNGFRIIQNLSTSSIGKIYLPTMYETKSDLEIKVLNMYNSYYNTSSESSIIDTLLGNNSYLSKIKTLELCAESGLGIFSKLYSTIIDEEKDTTVIIQALQSCAELGYDSGEVLESIEKLSRKRFIRDNNLLQIKMCECIYSICKFMGKPIIFNKGKDILVYLLSDSTNSGLNDYARLTMQKIIALQM